MSRVVNRIDNKIQSMNRVTDNGNFNDGIKEGLNLAATCAEDELQRIVYEIDQQIRLCEETGHTDQALGLKQAFKILVGAIEG